MFNPLFPHELEIAFVFNSIPPSLMFVEVIELLLPIKCFFFFENDDWMEEKRYGS